MAGDEDVDAAVAGGDDAEGHHVGEHEQQHHIHAAQGLVGQIVESTTEGREEERDRRLRQTAEKQYKAGLLQRHDYC